MAGRSSGFEADGADKFIEIIDDALVEAVELGALPRRQPGVPLDGVEKAGGERRIDALEELQEPDRGITINAGVIAGGSRTNVIADRATAQIDVRVQTMADAVRLEGAIRALRATRPLIRLEISGGINRPPLERSGGVVRLYERAR